MPLRASTCIARSIAALQSLVPVPTAALNAPTSHEPRQAPGHRAVAGEVGFQTVQITSGDLSEHDKTSVVIKGVPGRILGAAARSSMATAVGRGSCGRLWAAEVARRDHIGVLALGRQQKVAKNETIGAHLEREVIVRELVRHVDGRHAADSTSSSTRRLEGMSEAS